MTLQEWLKVETRVPYKNLDDEVEEKLREYIGLKNGIEYEVRLAKEKLHFFIDEMKELEKFLKLTIFRLKNILLNIKTQILI